MSTTNESESKPVNGREIDVEVLEKSKLETPKRRRFTTEYKRRILAEVEAVKERGEIGAIMRREGIYRSTLNKWRKQFSEEQSQEPVQRPRGRKAKSATERELKQVHAEKTRLEEQLRQAELIIEIQKKVCQLLKGVAE